MHYYDLSLDNDLIQITNELYPLRVCVKDQLSCFDCNQRKYEIR